MQQPRNDLVGLLGISEDAQWMLTALHLGAWGRALQFEGIASLYETMGVPEFIRFRIQFEECREMRWRIYVHEAVENALTFAPTPIYGFASGRSDHRSPAQIFAGGFGLSLVYGTLTVSRVDDTP